MKNLFRLLIIIVIVLLCQQFKTLAQEIYPSKIAVDYFKNKGDTINYWQKPITTEWGDQLTLLVPRIDTVMCYSLIITQATEGYGLADTYGIEKLKTEWWRIWAIRDKEIIIGYCDNFKNKIHRKIIQTVLLTPIFKY